MARRFDCNIFVDGPGRREAACRHHRTRFHLWSPTSVMTTSTSMLARSNNALAANVRTSGINLCPSHDNEGSVVMADIVLPTALLVIAVVALGAFLLYIFSWQQRH